MTKKSEEKKDLESILDCPLHAAINVIGGKWKTIILYVLDDHTMRFGELKKSIPKITQKMLTQQLRELEADGLVTRVIYSEVPPKVEYNLTKFAKELRPILSQLCEWGSRLN